jgi:small subunit ribosomal protein S1
LQRFFSFLSFKKSENDLPDFLEQPAASDDQSALRESEYAPGQELGGWILKVSPGGIVVTLPNTETGLVLRDEISWPGYPVSYKKGNWVDVVVTSVKRDRGLFLSIRKAKSAERVKAIYDTIKVGAIMQGRIKSIKDYGVFVSVGPGVQGLCHESNIADISKFGKHSIGKDIDVRVIEFDPANDRIQLEPV